MTTLVMRLASLLVAIENCKKSGNSEWEERHGETIDDLVKGHFPSGSGFDGGTFLTDQTRPNRLVIKADYHHMTEGYYDGWTEHEVIVTPDLAFGFDLRITGRNRNDIKEYIAQIFYEVLSKEVS